MSDVSRSKTVQETEEKVVKFLKNLKKDQYIKLEVLASQVQTSSDVLHQLSVTSLSKYCGYRNRKKYFGKVNSIKQLKDNGVLI